MKITDRAQRVLAEIDAALALAETDGELLQELAADFEAAHSFENSYGVPGSEWACCDICKAEDRPGVFAAGIPHEESCKVFRAKRIVADSRTLLPASLRCLKTAIEWAISQENCHGVFAPNIFTGILTTLLDQWDSK